MSILDLLRRTPADKAWSALSEKMELSINSATAKGDPKAAAYFTSLRGSPSVYVPFGFHVASLLGVSTDSDTYVSSRGRGFEHHKARIEILAAPYRVTSWEEKCGLDLCFADPNTQSIVFAYEAEMSIIAGVPASASRANTEMFSEEHEKSFYLKHLKDLDKLLQIDCNRLFYLGRVGNNNWETELPKLRIMIEHRARRTLEASCSPQRDLTILLTTGRKQGGSTSKFHYAVGLWASGEFSWTKSLLE